MFRKSRNNSVEVEILNYESVQASLGEDLKNNARAVIKRTLSDVKTRVPGWIAPEVMREYNIKKKDINAAISNKDRMISKRSTGERVGTAFIKYEGRVLTPTHFQMKPRKRYKRNRPYVVTAQIKKGGERKALGRDVFLASPGGLSDIQIPFQRIGDKRLPVKVIKTLSVPQMITNEKVSKEIEKKLNREIGKRLSYNIDRVHERKYGLKAVPFKD